MLQAQAFARLEVPHRALLRRPRAGMWRLRQAARWGEGMSRYAARVDETQAEVVKAFRDNGAYVIITGLPVDLNIGFKGHTVWVEVKKMVGKKQPRQTDYTDLQLDFFAKWTGGPIATVCDAEGAKRLLRSLEAS